MMNFDGLNEQDFDQQLGIAVRFQEDCLTIVEQGSFDWKIWILV